MIIVKKYVIHWLLTVYKDTDLRLCKTIDQPQAWR